MHARRLLGERRLPAHSGRTGLLALAIVLLAAPVSAAAAPHDELHEMIGRASDRIRESPGRAHLYLSRAELHRRHRDWPATFADLDRAAELDPATAGLDHARGRLFLDLGWLASAQAALDRAHAQDPGDGSVLETRSHLHTLRGDLAAAVADADLAIDRLQAPQPDTYLARARLLRGTGRADLLRALAGLDEGIRRIGGSPALVLETVAIEAELGRTDAALLRLRNAAAGSRRPEAWLLREGDLLAGAGRPGAAATAYRACLAAIESLPERRRRTVAVRELDARARAGLTGLPIPR